MKKSVIIPSIFVFTILTLITLYAASDYSMPQFSNPVDNSNNLTNQGLGLFNITMLNTNGTVFLEINNTNITARNITSALYLANYTFTSNGTYSYRWVAYGNGSNNYFNVSTYRNYIVLYGAPTFSNYRDNNFTLTDSGLGLFNVTLANTNGSVWLEINNVNVTARNLTPTLYLANYTFTSNGTYSYRWGAYGTDLDHVLNFSIDRNYTVVSSNLTSCISYLVTPFVNYTLRNNISTDSVCFIIRASNVTLDLNGYTINGSGASYPNMPGIYADTVSQVLIRNGTIKNFGDMGFYTGYGIYFYNSNNSVIENITLTSNDGGLYLRGSSFNRIYNLTISNNHYQGISFEDSVNNTFTNLLIYSNPSGILANIYSFFNTFLNLDIYNSSTLGFDLGNSTLDNQNNLIYSNAYGEIRFGTLNQSINGDVIFNTASLPSVVNTITLANNSAFVNSTAVPTLNLSANVTLFNLPTNMANPKIYRDGVLCSDCYNFTSLNAGNVTFNVSSWSSYSITNHVVVSIVVGSESSSGGGGSNFIGNVPYNLLENGVSKNLWPGSYFSFNIFNSTHSFTLNKVSNESVSVVVRSDSQNFNIALGDSVNVDLNKDKIYDVHISYEKYLSKYAQIRMNAISIPVADVKNGSITEDDINNIIENNQQNKKTFDWVILSGVVGILIIGFIVYYVFTSRRKNKTYSISQGSRRKK